MNEAADGHGRSTDLKPTNGPSHVEPSEPHPLGLIYIVKAGMELYQKRLQEGHSVEEMRSFIDMLAIMSAALTYVECSKVRRPTACPVASACGRMRNFANDVLANDMEAINSSAITILAATKKIRDDAALVGRWLSQAACYVGTSPF